MLRVLHGVQGGNWQRYHLGIDEDKTELDSLLTLRFQTFTKAQALAA